MLYTVFSMPKPRISVLMAVHNSMEFLKGAVESILNQNYTDFEFIIIDDGSSDGSGEWLEAKAKEDQRIHLVRQANIGLTKSLNRGLALARGEFIARMDSDDVCLSNRLETQLAFLRRNFDVVACGSNVEMIDSDGDLIGVYHVPQTHEDIEAHFWSGGLAALVHPSAMIRRDALVKISGYNERFPKCQDYDLWFRLAEIGRLVNLPQVLIQWRQHASSISYRAPDEQFRIAQEVYYNAARRRGLDVDKLPAIGKVSREKPWDCHVEWANSALHSQNFYTAKKHAKIALQWLPRNSPAYHDMSAIHNGFAILKCRLRRETGGLYWFFVKIYRRIMSFSCNRTSSL